MVEEQPENGGARCTVGLIESGLGSKEEPVREGVRACQLVPVSKDAINGALLVEFLAVIYSWTGEKNLALEQLKIAASLPNDVSYGQLRLHPYWDDLRGDPAFERLVTSLAPHDVATRSPDPSPER